MEQSSLYVERPFLERQERGREGEKEGERERGREGERERGEIEKVVDKGKRKHITPQELFQALPF